MVSHNRPVFSGGVDRITIHHKELIGRVDSSSPEWTNHFRLDCNPGNATAFPWLAPVAWSWESYKWRGLKFVFEPRCPTTTPGAVQFFFDYDWADFAPPTERVASSYTGFMESNPWNRCTNSANSSAMYQSKPTKYVLPSTGYPDSSDPTNYSSGHFYTYSVGTPELTLGSLWVEYTVDLMFPTAGNGLSLQLAMNANAFTNAADTMVLDEPFTGNLSIGQTSDLMPIGWNQSNFIQVSAKSPIVVYNEATGDISIPGPGIFQINLSYIWSGLTTWVQSPTVADIVAGSDGLSLLGEQFDSAAYNTAQGRVMGIVVAITGALGVFRIASPTAGWTLNKASSTSIASAINVVINFIAAINAFGPILPLTIKTSVPQKFEGKEYKGCTVKHVEQPKLKDAVLYRRAPKASATSVACAFSASSSVCSGTGR